MERLTAVEGPDDVGEVDAAVPIVVERRAASSECARNETLCKDLTHRGHGLAQISPSAFITGPAGQRPVGGSRLCAGRRGPGQGRPFPQSLSSRGTEDAQGGPPAEPGPVHRAAGRNPEPARSRARTPFSYRAARTVSRRRKIRAGIGSPASIARRTSSAPPASTAGGSLSGPEPPRPGPPRHRRNRAGTGGFIAALRDN